ncbi:MAG: hypothetical protein ACLQOO_29270, partial [Terriglobia bacterium]
MAVETEAVPNPDAQRGAQPQGDGVRDSGFGVRREEAGRGFVSADSQSDANREHGTEDSEQRRSANPEAQTPSTQTEATQTDPNQPKKPKRKYTMSPRAIESRRINIKKALAVPKEVLYRSTPKRKESC